MPGPHKKQSEHREICKNQFLFIQGGQPDLSLILPLLHQILPLCFFIGSVPDVGSLLCPSSSLASLPGKLQDAYEWKVYSLFESVSGKTSRKAALRAS